MGNCAGVDWASEKHDVLIADLSGKALFAGTSPTTRRGSRVCARC